MPGKANELEGLFLSEDDLDRFDSEDDDILDIADPDDDLDIDLELTGGYERDRGAYIEGTIRISID